MTRGRAGRALLLILAALGVSTLLVAGVFAAFGKHVKVTMTQVSP